MRNAMHSISSTQTKAIYPSLFYYVKYQYKYLGLGWDWLAIRLFWLGSGAKINPDANTNNHSFFSSTLFLSLLKMSTRTFSTYNPMSWLRANLHGSRFWCHFYCYNIIAHDKLRKNHNSLGICCQCVWISRRMSVRMR